MICESKFYFNTTKHCEGKTNCAFYLSYSTAPQVCSLVVNIPVQTSNEFGNLHINTSGLL